MPVKLGICYFQYIVINLRTRTHITDNLIQFTHLKHQESKPLRPKVIFSQGHTLQITRPVDQPVILCQPASGFDYNSKVQKPDQCSYCKKCIANGKIFKKNTVSMFNYFLIYCYLLVYLIFVCITFFTFSFGFTFLFLSQNFF